MPQCLPDMAAVPPADAEPTQSPRLASCHAAGAGLALALTEPHAGPGRLLHQGAVRVFLATKVGEGPRVGAQDVLADGLNECTE